MKMQPVCVVFSLKYPASSQIALRRGLLLLLKHLPRKIRDYNLRRQLGKHIERDGEVGEEQLAASSPLKLSGHLR